MIFHVVRNRFYIGEQLTLCHSSCLLLACQFDSPYRLTRDIQKWGRDAKHGDTYMINYKLHILAIDTSTFLGTYPDPVADPTKSSTNEELLRNS